MPEPSLRLPGTLALTMYRGDSYSWQFVLWQDANKTQPVDLTGVTAKSEIRDKPGGALLETFTPLITLPNTITLSLDATKSSQMPVSGGVWDLQLTYLSGGTVSTVVGGTIAVTPDVTDSGPESMVEEAPPATGWRSVKPRTAANA